MTRKERWKITGASYIVGPMAIRHPEGFGQQTLIGSGALGTWLREQTHTGLPSVELLNLSEPEAVQAAYAAYRAAGADVIVTNTFAANPITFGEFNRSQSCEGVNRAGVAMAREVADGAAVWCSVGPPQLGLRIDDYSDEALKDSYSEQISYLEDGDALILETFRDVREARAALAAASESDLPVIFHIASASWGRTRELVGVALNAGVDAIGTNCSDPVRIVQVVEFLASASDLPVTAFPNAGNPRLDRGRVMYDFTPENMAELGRRCIDAGACLVGGCCGTTPDHIARLKAAIDGRPLAIREFDRVEVSAPVLELPPVPRGRNQIREMMQSDDFVISVEIRPSRTKPLNDIVTGARAIVDAGASMLDVPDNAAAMVGRDAMVTASTLQRTLNIPALAHKSVTQTNLLHLQSYLLGCWDSGLQGLLCISGDPPATGHLSGLASRVTDLRSSVELLRLLGRMRNGELINGDPIADPPDFCTGCGVGSGSNMKPQVRWLEKKVEAGAEFAFSQPVFSIEQYRHLRETTAHCNIRLLPGIFPIISRRNAEYLAAGRVPGIVVPEELVEQYAAYDDPADQRKFGLEFTRELMCEVARESNGLYVIMPFGKQSFSDTADLVGVVREQVSS